MNNFLIENLDVIRAYQKVNESVSTSKEDSDYLNVVERGDLASAQKMVDVAAKKAGYNVKLWNASRSSFSVFKPKSWFAQDKRDSEPFGNPKQYWVKITNSVNLANQPVPGGSFNATSGEPDGVWKFSEKMHWAPVFVADIGGEQIKSAEPVIRDSSDKIIPLSKRFDSSSSDVKENSDDSDAEYLSAVANEDWKTVQTMVDEAAKKAGYTVGPVWHGTNSKFTEFSPQFSGGIGYYFAPYPEHYSVARSSRVIRAFLRMGNTAKASTYNSELAKHGGGNPRKATVDALIKQGFDSASRGATDSGEQIEYIVFSPEQIKLADPVTYDDGGKIIPLSKRFNSYSSDIRENSNQVDSEYLKSVAKEDWVSAQKMVDTAAKRAGYNVGPMYHGTRASFSTFDKSAIGANYSGYNIGGGFWFTSNEEFAYRWGGKAKGSNPVKVLRVFLRINNPIKDEKGKPLSDILKDARKNNSGDGIVTGRFNYPHMDAMVFDSTQIKSAEVVCRDDSGKIIPLSKRFNSSSSDIRETSNDIDSEYLKAVDRKDWATVQKMVDDAARKNGYSIETWRGDSEKYNNFSGRFSHGIFTSKNKDFADEYGDKRRSGVTRRFYVKSDKILDLTDYQNGRWIQKWATRFDDWVDRISGEDVDPIDVVNGGGLFDWEGDWSSGRWEDLQRAANSDGYSVVIVADTGGTADNTATIILNDTDIKLADPVTRDDSGEIISLSKRFDSSSMDVREDSEDIDSEYIKAVEEKDSDEIRRLVDKAAEKLIKSIPVSTNKNPIPNSSSISSSLSDYEIFGVREVPIGWFQTGGIKTRYSVSDVMRVKELMELIKRDGVVSPLIVVVDGDKDGIAYILEGGHRFDAIWELGLNSFPALVIYDNDSEAIIRDDSGKIIPLSKRFDRSSSDIRE